MQPLGEEPPTSGLTTQTAEPPLPVFRDPVVVVALAEDGLIESIRVEGRPTHPFGSGEGLHVTAWAVFADAVRRGSTGGTVAAASQFVAGLCLRLDTTANRNRLEPTWRRRQFAAAVRRSADASALAQDVTAPVNALFGLQAQIAAYLSARNLAPFVQADLGPGQAIGGGEPAALLVLREFESQAAAYPADDLRMAIWTLFDQCTALFALSPQAVSKTLPGVLHGDTGTFVVWQMVVTHLTEIRTAYPLSFNACGLADATKVQSFVLACTGSADIAGNPPHGLLPVANQPSVQAAVPGWARRRGGTRRCAVSLTLALDDQFTISEVRFGARPTTLLNTDGHHLTAWVSFTRLITRTIKGKASLAALHDLIALAQHLLTMPTFPSTAQISFGQDPKMIFKSACDWFDDVLDIALHTDDAQDAPVVVQDLAAAYLALRNALPLAAVFHGSLANTHGEQFRVQRLDAWEVTGLAGVDPGFVRQTLWELLDIAMLNVIWSDEPMNAIAPGSSPARVVRVANAIKVHLITMAACWPLCYQHAELDGELSITAVIASADSVNIDDWGTFFNAIGGVQPRKGKFKHKAPIGDMEESDGGN